MGLWLGQVVTTRMGDHKQHVYAYLQPFSHYMSQYWQNNIFLAGTPN